eukprot:gene22341-8864_t
MVEETDTLTAEVERLKERSKFDKEELNLQIEQWKKQVYDKSPTDPQSGDGAGAVGNDAMALELQQLRKKLDTLQADNEFSHNRYREVEAKLEKSQEEASDLTRELAAAIERYERMIQQRDRDGEAKKQKDDKEDPKVQ